MRRLSLEWSFRSGGFIQGRSRLGHFPNWDDCSPWSKGKAGGVEEKELLEVIGLIFYNVGLKGARQEPPLLWGWGESC